MHNMRGHLRLNTRTWKEIYYKSFSSTIRYSSITRLLLISETLWICHTMCLNLAQVYKSTKIHNWTVIPQHDNSMVHRKHCAKHSIQQNAVNAMHEWHENTQLHDRTIFINILWTTTRVTDCKIEHHGSTNRSFFQVSTNKTAFTF